MEAGPPLAVYRNSQQTTLRCFKGNDEVLNGQGKGSIRSQVRVKEMNASEPLKKCRKT